MIQNATQAKKSRSFPEQSVFVSSIPSPMISTRNSKGHWTLCPCEALTKQEWPKFVWVAHQKCCLFYSWQLRKRHHFWWTSQTIFVTSYFARALVQVNLCQKLSFLNQLTHNMTRDFSLNSPKNTSSTHIVYKNFVFIFVLTFKTKFYTTCCELENESFWKRFYL